MPLTAPRPLSIALFSLAGVACLTPWLSPSFALVLGILLALALGNPWPRATPVWTRQFLSWSIIALGAGMNLGEVFHTGLRNVLTTFGSITATLLLGFVLARLLQIRGKAPILVAVGTAICGGSAIAALAPTLEAPEEDTGIALATVFLFNAIALILFPPIGRLLHLTQHAFGLWSALAIHDTSSVVGAGLAYGPESLAVATTVKLTRALWIVPLTLAFGAFIRPARQASRRYPWFILGFVLSAACSPPSQGWRACVPPWQPWPTEA